MHNFVILGAPLTGRAIRGSAVATLDAAKLLTNAKAPLLSLARLLAMGFNLLDCPFMPHCGTRHSIATQQSPAAPPLPNAD